MQQDPRTHISLIPRERIAPLLESFSTVVPNPIVDIDSLVKRLPKKEKEVDKVMDLSDVE